MKAIYTASETLPHPLEIERKFLVTTLPKHIRLADCKAYEIDQGYMAVTADCSIRLRRKGDKYFLTYKGAPLEHAASHVEMETEITKDQFDAMWPTTAGKRLQKTRYEIDHGSYTIELDIFNDDRKAAGAMLVEVEFDSTKTADAFVPPEWFGLEVTSDNAYTNASIAVYGFPNIHNN